MDFSRRLYRWASEGVDMYALWSPRGISVADPGCGERGGGAHPSKIQVSTGLSYSAGPVAYRGRGPGEKIDKQQKKGLQQTKEKKHPLRHREHGTLEYATVATRLIRHIG